MALKYIVDTFVHIESTSMWSHLAIIVATNIHVNYLNETRFSHEMPNHNMTCYASHCSGWNNYQHRFVSSLLWSVVMGVLVISGLPTITLQSKNKTTRLRVLSIHLLQVLLMAGISMLIPYSIWVYLVSLHSTLQILVEFNPGELLGASCAYVWKHLGIVAILCITTMVGPPMSIMHPHNNPKYLECVYIGHLMGCLLWPVLSDTLSLVWVLVRHGLAT